MPTKKLGATGEVTPKVIKRLDPLKDQAIDGAATCRAQGAHRGTPQTAQREGGARLRADALRLRRAAILRRQRRHRLIEAAINCHGVAALEVLFERLECDFGDELQLDSRLQGLIDFQGGA
jgi:hypothetical protein